MPALSIAEVRLVMRPCNPYKWSSRVVAALAFGVALMWGVCGASEVRICLQTIVQACLDLVAQCYPSQSETKSP